MRDNVILDCKNKPDNCDDVQKWREVFSAENSHAIIERGHDFDVSAFAEAALQLAEQAPFADRCSGDMEDITAFARQYPLLLADDIVVLARQFMALMDVKELRVRLEGIAGDACRKLHQDYTDIRLISCYHGAGSLYLPDPHIAAEDYENHLEQVPLGAVALFKGKLFHPDHIACVHRSPAIAGTGQKRLLLVMDTLDKIAA